MWKDKRNVTITYDLLPPVTVDAGENNYRETDEKKGATEDDHGNGSGSGSAGGNGKIDAHSSRAPAASAGSVARRTVELARLDDTVRYQKKRSKGGSGWGSGGGSVNTVRGIDTAVRTRTSATSVSESESESESEAMRWRWKGSGWVTRWFSSQWEVLGFGDEGGDGDGNGDRAGDGAGDGDGDGRNYWLVTYFSKTLVTPAGIDILSRRAGGPAEETVQRIRDALREQVPDEGVRRLEGMLFAVESEDLG